MSVDKSTPGTSTATATSPNVLQPTIRPVVHRGKKYIAPSGTSLPSQQTGLTASARIKNALQAGLMGMSTELVEEPEKMDEGMRLEMTHLCKPIKLDFFFRYADWVFARSFGFAGRRGDSGWIWLAWTSHWRTLGSCYSTMRTFSGVSSAIHDGRPIPVNFSLLAWLHPSWCLSTLIANIIFLQVQRPSSLYGGDWRCCSPHLATESVGGWSYSTRASSCQIRGGGEWKRRSWGRARTRARAWISWGRYHRLNVSVPFNAYFFLRIIMFIYGVGFF